jgi:hypothetical protein
MITDKADKQKRNVPMKIIALPTDQVRGFQAGGTDAYGSPAERHISDGEGNPCRHCLCNIPEGHGMLVLALRPFDGLHPYAETGPIFLCADACERGGGHTLPPILRSSPDYLLKGYGADERIVYGTGAIVAADDIEAYAARVFEDPQVQFLHARSARNNCYQLRIDRE